MDTGEPYFTVQRWLFDPFRRRSQLVECGFHCPPSSSYQEIGNVVLDDKDLILRALGQVFTWLHDHLLHFIRSLCDINRKIATGCHLRKLRKELFEQWSVQRYVLAHPRSFPANCSAYIQSFKEPSNFFVSLRSFHWLSIFPFFCC